jgi:ferredoxin-thioredoxin reductase catalytic subunit
MVLELLSGMVHPELQTGSDQCVCRDILENDSEKHCILEPRNLGF